MHHRLAWFGGSGTTTPEEGEGGEHGGGRFAGLVMQLVDKAREEKARLALGMGGNQGAHHGRDVATSPSSAAGVSTSPHGQAVNSLATPGEAPTELPASYIEGRSSVADSGIELHSKKSEKSVGDAHQGVLAAEQLEMKDLQAQGVTPQDFERVGMGRQDGQQNLKLDTGGMASRALSDAMSSDSSFHIPNVRSFRCAFE